MEKIKHVICIIGLILITSNTNAQNTKEINISHAENWWGFYSAMGQHQPFNEHTDVSINQYKNDAGNQSSPVLVSSNGRYIWSEYPLKAEIKDGRITLKSEGEIVVGQARDGTLASAYQAVSSNFFPPSGTIPGKQLFSHPQLNTWMELLNNQNQKDVLEYAREAKSNGISPGVIMIDAGWSVGYGVAKFNSNFPAPKKMVDELHKMGYKVMLWVVPYVTADHKVNNKAYKKGYLLKDPEKKKQPYFVHWWQGFSAAFDLSKPKAKLWYLGRLNNLVDNYNIDGFKFDAGDPGHFEYPFKSHKSMSANEYTTAFGRVGLHYQYNEYRASFKLGGEALGQRMRDKSATWKALKTLIPDMVTAGLMGYPYTCADMIGGGLAGSYVDSPEEFAKGIKHLNIDIDQELFVRWAQVQALMPMMQISIAPWSVLDKKHYDVFLKALKIHESYAPFILRLAREASKDGESIVRNMEYEFPHKGYSNIKDQFMLGDSLLVAPVITEDKRTRKVVLPKGLWVSDDGNKIKGGKTIKINIPLDRLAYFKRVR